MQVSDETDSMSQDKVRRTQSQAIIDEYLASFGDPQTDGGTYKKDSRLAKAYEVALDIRKFEIDLYWKRSTSFWLLLGGLSAVLGIVAGGKLEATWSLPTIELIGMCVALAGATISLAWWLVNKGSKFWQRNWEYQVQLLERDVLGPLYKTVFADRNTRVMYSVTALNEYISLCFLLIFSVAALAFFVGREGFLWAIGLIPRVFDGWDAKEHPIVISYVAKIVVLLVTMVVAGLGYWRARNKRETDEVNFDVYAEASIRTVHVESVYYKGAAREQWLPPASAPAQGYDLANQKPARLRERWKLALRAALAELRCNGSDT